MLDPVLRPSRQLTETEKILLAQYHVNNGDPGKAIGVFDASPVGNGLDPSVQKALLGLTAYAELPSAEVMADKPGVQPLQLGGDTIEKVIKGLPNGRAAGTLLTTYELIKGTYYAGAKTGWVKYFKAFAAGALSDSLAAMARALRAVLLDKDGLGCNWRPCGIGEAERRVGCACVATDRKKRWNEFYTTELPAVKTARLAKIDEADQCVEMLKGTVAATAARGGTRAAKARCDLADAVASAEAAKRPPNFPVQLCYAANGTEILGHSLEGFTQLAPDDTLIGCDTYNMYNESERAPLFEALHEHDPESKPVYRMLYGHPADIYLDRTDNGSVVRLTMDEVCQRAPRIGIDPEGIDTTDPDESLSRAFEGGELPPIFNSIVRKGGAVLRSVVVLFLVSTRGFHQGCGLATNGACMPYHIVLGQLQADYPNGRAICFGDDTYRHDESTQAFAWRDEKERRCVELGHRARLDKEVCYSPTGTLEGAPDDMPGSPAMGRGRGIKAAGYYIGDDEWVRRQLSLKAEKLVKPLDDIDRLRDVGDVHNSSQIKSALVTYCASGMPNHWLRGQRTRHTTVAPVQQPSDALPPLSMTDVFDTRSAESFERLVDARHSPADRRARAVQQARLPTKIGGHGLLNTTSIAMPAHTASFLACWPRMQRWFPVFADVDLLTTDCVWLAELRTEYETLRMRRHAVAEEYRTYAKDLLHYCDGETTRPRFRPQDLAPAKATPPLKDTLDDTSIHPPAQRQLASIVYHEWWLACVAANRDADERDAAAGTATRRRRETTRLIDASQPYAGAMLKELPVDSATRRDSAEWVWAMQRRYGLYVSAALPTFELHARRGDTSWDPVGDKITFDKGTDKSAPHRAALTEWHDAHQATATHAVVMGDKTKEEVYAIYNEGCVVDLAEERMGKGGGDRCVELKVYSNLVPHGASAPDETTFRGDTHAFGNTEERLIHTVLGVVEREGDGRWDPAVGAGAVKAHRGAYHDAIHVKRNTVLLFLHSHFGGFGPGAVAGLRELSKRGVDRTEYVTWTAASFTTYWAQRISAAIVTADARRCLKRLSALRGQVRGDDERTAARRDHAPPAQA